MAVQSVRAGALSDCVHKYFREGRVYITWEGLDVDLLQTADRKQLLGEMLRRYPSVEPRAIAMQIGRFGEKPRSVDLITLPKKPPRAVPVAKVPGNYQLEPDVHGPLIHCRTNWLAASVPGSNFGQRLPHSLGRFLTICRSQQSHSELRTQAFFGNCTFNAEYSAIGDGLFDSGRLVMRTRNFGRTRPQFLAGDRPVDKGKRCPSEEESEEELEPQEQRRPYVWP
jgi:predicted Mrr-cat superfamily restriction endonuclease